MILVVIFTLSGLAITLLVATKKWGENRQKVFFVSNIISKGDKHTREFYHRVIRFYSEGKEKIIFFFQRQVPIHSRNLLNKLLVFLKAKREQYLVSLRDSKLLKKSDGISEFFKNTSSIEKGNGEIHDVYEDHSQNEQKRID